MVGQPAHPYEESPPEGFPEILPIDSRRYTELYGRKRTSYDNSWHTDVTSSAAQGSSRATVIANKPLRTFHPVVRVHPETGERALFVSPGFTRKAKNLRGLGPRLSSHLLDALWEEATRTEYTVRFRWQPGSVAFWDNRATAHLAIPDAGHLGHDRVLYRVTIEGDVPKGVDGRASESVQGEPFYGS